MIRITIAHDTDQDYSFLIRLEDISNVKITPDSVLLTAVRADEATCDFRLTLEDFNTEVRPYLEIVNEQYVDNQDLQARYAESRALESKLVSQKFNLHEELRQANNKIETLTIENEKMRDVSKPDSVASFDILQAHRRKEMEAASGKVKPDTASYSSLVQEIEELRDEWRKCKEKLQYAHYENNILHDEKVKLKEENAQLRKIANDLSRRIKPEIPPNVLTPESKCEKCGSKNIVLQTLLTLPAQYVIKCNDCGNTYRVQS